MPSGSNGNNAVFIRAIFWALLVGSFGWASFIGITGMSSLNGHCAEAKTTMDCMKNDYTTRDEVMLKELTKEFKEINVALAEQRSDIKWIKEKVRCP